jgi:alanine transaminase
MIILSSTNRDPSNYLSPIQFHPFIWLALFASSFAEELHDLIFMLSSLCAPFTRAWNRAWPRLSESDLSSSVKDVEYAIFGPMDIRAEELKQELAAGKPLSFRKLIPCHIGNPYAVGKPVLTFPRQVLSIAEFPGLAKSGIFPDEAVDRALTFIGGGDSSPIMGIYSPLPGFNCVRQNIARWIEKRDGVPSDWQSIYVTQGASAGIWHFLQTIITGASDGIMLPVPRYPLYSALVSLFGAQLIPYDLIEEECWSFDIDSILASVKRSRDKGVRVKAFVAVNPGNPTGTVLSRTDMKRIIDLCETEGIVLIGDEVYQENVYGNVEWVSFKKVASEMHSKVQLVSVNSISKGFFGECGHRCGYFEFTNVDDGVIRTFHKLMSLQLPANSAGQLLMSVLTNPPIGSVCGQLWNDERTRELESLAKRAHELKNVMAKLPGLKPQPVQGAMYLFPGLELPKKFLTEVKGKTWRGEPMPADLEWCMRLVNEEGIVPLPGSGFGQKEGTYHVRMTFLPTEQNMSEVVERLSRFQTKFMNLYGG